MNQLTQISQATARLNDAQLGYDMKLPQDDSVQELALEAKQESEYQDYLACGHLPGGKDASHVDALLLDEMPECLHDLSAASEKRFGRDEAIRLIAERIISKRESIVQALIAEELNKEVS